MKVEYPTIGPVLALLVDVVFPLDIGAPTSPQESASFCIQRVGCSKLDVRQEPQNRNLKLKVHTQRHGSRRAWQGQARWVGGNNEGILPWPNGRGNGPETFRDRRASTRDPKSASREPSARDLPSSWASKICCHSRWVAGNDCCRTGEEKNRRFLI